MSVMGAVEIWPVDPVAKIARLQYQQTFTYCSTCCFPTWSQPGCLGLFFSSDCVPKTVLINVGYAHVFMRYVVGDPGKTRNPLRSA